MFTGILTTSPKELTLRVEPGRLQVATFGQFDRVKALSQLGTVGFAERKPERFAVAASPRSERLFETSTGQGPEPRVGGGSGMIPKGSRQGLF